MEEIDLNLTVPETLLLKSPFVIKVKLLPCPLGFSLSGSPPKCDCAAPLNESTVFKCNTHNQTIHYPAGMWLGYNGLDSVNTSTINGTIESIGIIQHNHCPFDYCKHGFTDVNLEEQDEQCAFNHSGVLCGGCRQGFSLALGSSRCLTYALTHTCY